MTWFALCAEADFPEDGKLATVLNGWAVLAVRAEDGIHAVIDRCTHQAALLSPGRVRRGAILCPLHGSRFEVTTGKCIGGVYPDLRRFDVRVLDGMIEVELPDTPPGPAERPVGV